MRNRLIELLKSPHKAEQLRQKGVAIGNYEDDCIEAMIADFLLAEGVIVPPCKVGQTVWVLNQSRGAIYENRIACIKVRSESRYKNTIRVEYHNSLGEASYRKFTWAQIGRQVFLTREEAEKALERSENDNT